MIRIAPKIAAPLVLAFGCIVVVCWVRWLPLSLPGAETLAEKAVELRLRQQIAPQVIRQVPVDEQAASIDEAVREWSRRNAAEVGLARQKLTEQFRSQLTFTGEDGRRYEHLGDYDSYVWLRNARNYLERGTTCDAIVRGECRDRYGNAPVGYRMLYNRSLHIAAIVAADRLMNFFHPGYPLAASAFWVPVILGALGVVPAFFIGRRFGGNVAGITAALTISLDPVYLLRSAGSDNDVWNVVMPLYIAWAMVAALETRTTLRATALALIASVFTGLHGAVWRGWLFTYAVVLSAAAGALFLAWLSRPSRESFRRAFAAAELRAGAYAMLTYALLSVGIAWFVGGPLVFSAAERFGARADSLWPVAFMAVMELGKPLSGDLTQYMGGRIFCLLAWIGLLALVLPEKNFKRRHIALGVWIIALFAAQYFVLAGVALPRRLFIFLFASPLVAELLTRAAKREPAAMTEPAVVLVVIWFFAALEEVYGGLRFLLLFAPPFGFAVGAFTESLRSVLVRALAATAAHRAVLIGALSTVIALAVVAYPVYRGYRAMRDYYPEMNSAWWDTMMQIKKESPPDAIVNAWWDYGYWIKYAAERRVSSDGGSLATHVPHWLAKALVAPSDVETRGILRMLNCGSEATPLPEARFGALGKFAALGVDEYRAYGFLIELVGLDRDAAARYLQSRGFAPEAQSAILASTHCRPPESFLTISKEMILKGEWWMSLGTWDVRRAYLAKRTRRLPEPQALQDLVRLRYTPAEAKTLYETVRGLTDQERVDDFIAPPQRLIPTDWIPCREAGGQMACDITITQTDGVVRLAFVYDPGAPKSAQLIEGRLQGPPAALLIAGAETLDEVLASNTSFPATGVLLDVAGRRILIGSPLLIRSTLVRLFYLDGRYSRIFKPFSRRTALLDEEVASFRIAWND